MVSEPATIKVWDPVVRLFHWALVGCFTVAYLSGDEWIKVHVLAGYGVAVLVGLRLVWGVLGSRHARFADFVRSPRAVFGYLGDLARGRARRYVGHNPAGGGMIVVMLIALVLLCAVGLALYLEQGGALWPIAAGWSERESGWGEWLEEGHELLANLMLVLVFVHIAGVVVESLVHRENLIRSMWTGRKRAEPDAR